MKNKSFKNLVLFFVVVLVLFGWTKLEYHPSHSHNGIEHSHAEDHQHNPQNYFDSYILVNEEYGTKTIVTVDEDKRKMLTNALPDHKTGEYPRKGNPNTISAQKREYVFPVNPKYLGTPTWVREPGVALNGVKFEPGTAEVVVCETGENYRVEAFQDLIDLGLDFNNAHVQPTGAYHYHGSPTSVIENFDTGEDLIHIGLLTMVFPFTILKVMLTNLVISYKMVHEKEKIVPILIRKKL